MPAFDKTGPLSQGPRTGRGLGLCGRGLGRRLGSQVSPKEEKEILEDEVKNLEKDLKSVKERLSELNTKI